MVISRAIASLCVGTLAFLAGGCVSLETKESLRQSVTLYASFDHGPDADYARGEGRVYSTIGKGKAQVTAPGLPATNIVRLAEGAGRFGEALVFTKKSDALVFFKGSRNVEYRPTNWNGTISFWLKLDPNKDLEPGYCDPLQLTAGNWSNGVFFAEFSKDENPRKFRFALRPLQKIWNPNNYGWEEIPAQDRPMVEVANPPFSREEWTHVAFAFENANTGRKDGIGRLYLNGAPAGEFRDWELTLNWNPAQIMVNIGAAYVGLFDELAVFNRALTPKEIKGIYRLPDGLGGVVR